MRRHASSLVLTLALAATTACDLLGRAPEIDEAQMRNDVAYLASDELAGRETGEPGVAAAEEYIAAAFREAGLAPLPGHEGYFAPFTLYRTGLDKARTILVVGDGAAGTSYEPGVDFRPFNFSGDGAVDGDVVFAGYGITAPEHEYDDYAGLDVQGRIVLVLRHEPKEDDPDSSFDGKESTRHAEFTVKAENAKEHGAVALLLVTDPLNHTEADDLRMGGRLRLDPPEESGAEGDEREPRPIAMQISRKVAEAIAAGSGRSLEELQSAIDGGTHPAELALRPVHARLATERLASAEAVPARDVVGFLEGSDPKLRDEWVVIGAHHDHIGSFSGEGDTVFNGADDNASGTSGLLALARAFAARKPHPRRSLVFATFSGEEKGLLGSKALVDQELIPVERVVFMLNLDMIGRNPDDRIEVYGDGYVPGLREAVDAANAGPDLPLDYAGADYVSNSDHDSFYQHDVPFAFFFTGVHDDYHQLGDHPDKLDYGRMRKIAELARGAIETIADADAAPRFIHHVTWLGIRVEVEGEGPTAGARVTGVDPGSRGEAAGLREGDLILSLDGATLAEARDVGRRFREIEPGSRAGLSVSRAGQLTELEVERARRSYLGIAPASPSDEQRAALGLRDDEGLLLRRVTDDGPAASAGLLEGDVLLSIAGRSVGMHNLSALLSQLGAGEVVDVEYVRDGERGRVEVTLGERPGRRN